MAHPSLRALAALVVLPLLAAAAQAGGALPDRAHLSYDDNVTINTACFAATQAGEGAFERCVARQLAMLPAHPGPDRRSVPPRRLAVAERHCNYLRRVGLAPYNDCLRAETAAAVERAAARD